MNRNTQKPVLVANDDAIMRLLFEEWAELLGFSPITASDGQEALELLAQVTTPLHFILSDVNMPRMGGVELSINLRCDPSLSAFHSTPIILATASIESSLVRDTSQERGVYILESVDYAALERMLRKLHLI